MKLCEEGVGRDKAASVIRQTRESRFMSMRLG